MKTKIFSFKDFETETISRKEQKTVKGGDGPGDQVDPRKNNGGNGNP